MTPSTPSDATTRHVLLIANIVMLLTIVIHDADHYRQAVNWCYTIPTSLWFINIAVYVPSSIALLLTLKSHRFSAIATSASSLIIVVEFAKVHLWMPSIPIWGIWNKTFFELGADWISWTILTALVAMGVLIAMTGAWAMGRTSTMRPI